MHGQLLDFVYLIAAVGFILALKGLTTPKSARAGNLIGAGGMALAFIATLVADGMHHWVLFVVALIAGTAIGIPAARLVRMTAMPQMVALFNGVGGGAAALVAYVDLANRGGHAGFGILVAVVFDVVIGAISFAGSAVAFAKLQELLPGKPITYPAQQLVNGVLAAGIVLLSAGILLGLGNLVVALAIVASLILGVAFVLPIGGADAPVVISLLNSFTGLAVAASGFVLGNTVLIVGGTLVGASGTLLTRMMSQAMGRSIANILFGAFGAVVASDGAGGASEARPVRSGNAEDIGTMLAYARQVVIVPGYGLAVAQAQHTVRELTSVLEAKGVEVVYAIHPVAGRMPGHMNVLLAEADVPYEQLKEMDEINPRLSLVDVVLVVGANDVVNPAARDSPGSPIFGMPILEVDQAKAIIFLKRSMRPGFAGIENELLYDPKTTLLFGDAKESLSKLVAAVKVA